MLHVVSSFCFKNVSKIRNMEKIIQFSEKILEDPKNPLLGPTLKGLSFIGLWRIGSKLQDYISNSVIFFACLIYVTQIIDLLMIRDDIPTLTKNLCTTSTATICLFKTFSLVFRHEEWKSLFQGIAYEEILERQRGDQQSFKITKSYTSYARTTSLLYAVLVCSSYIFMIMTPILDVLLTPGYRAAILDGLKPYPQYVSLWYPFDNTKPPGYIPAITTQVFISLYCAVVIMMFDLNSVAIMVFFKGHLNILKEKCKKLFDNDAISGIPTRGLVIERMKECHRHFNHLLELKNLYNSLLSPVMFLYVFICSVTICSTVVQFSMGEGQKSEKLFMLTFATALVLQLLIYCWHSTEVTYESAGVDRGLYESHWWRADVRTRKDLHLLGGQLAKSFVFEAGPFTALSLATFVEILKATYSFYTFLTRK